MRKHGYASLIQSYSGLLNCMTHVRRGLSVGSWLNMGLVKVYDRVVPAARLITRSQWKQHMRDVWNGSENTDAVVRPDHSCSEQCSLQLPVSGVVRHCLRRRNPRPEDAPRLKAVSQLSSGSSIYRHDPCVRSVCPLFQRFAWGPLKACSVLVRVGCNPQSWCDGEGCPLPKPGGVCGPNGQRIINLLDPASKLFYKALLQFVPDQAADHQYGYASSRSRRDAILHVEAWLDRLRANGLSSAATLFDLTKAFDTLALSCIEDLLHNEPMLVSVRELLLDLHRRLRISLKQTDGGTLQVKLGSGALQGGGTGPRIFRMVYDACITRWRDATRDSDLTASYNGQDLSLSAAAYADDLVRIQCGSTLKQLEDRTLACTHALTAELDPRNLKLNAKKGETLLSYKGKGAYTAAKSAFSGEWNGYPVKLCVKYLGAQLQANGSLKAELQKRFGAARSGFARFSKLFKRRTVPVARKVLIFKAVVNEALLAALEVFAQLAAVSATR